MPERTGPIESYLGVFADAGPTIGYGHVGRCLALAHAAPGRVVFSVNDPTAAAWVKARHGTVSDRRAAAAPVIVLDRRDPLAVADVARWQSRGRAVALIDEVGAARSVADACVDPPTAASWAPCRGIRLGGFAHVLLRSDVLDAGAERDGGPTPDGPLLVNMGGSDPYGLTAPVADALATTSVDLCVALGPGYSGPPVPGRRLSSPDRFAAALAGSSVFVTAFGHSVLEAAHLGVPSVCVVAHDDHFRDATHMASFGFVIVVDARQGLDRAVLLEAIGAATDLSWWAPASATGAALVDGHGAHRVVDALLSLRPI